MRNILVFIFGTLLCALLAATGCSKEESETSNPNTSQYQLPEEDRPPVGPQPSANGLWVGGGRKPKGSLFGGKGTGSGLGLFGAGLLIAGAIATRRRSWRWALPLLGAGLAVGFFFGGLSIGFGWWKVAWLVFLVLWAISLRTETKWDDRIVNVGAVAIFAIAALSQAMPFLQAWFGMPTLGWGLLQALGVFLIARGIWEEEQFQSGQRWLYTALLWAVLLITQ